MIRCAMSGAPMGIGDGVYDDGEWISWDWINGELDKQDVQREYPAVDPAKAMLFEALVRTASEYFAMTGRYLQIWGELGELYAEVKFGVKRHRPHTKGSDGKIGNDFVEVKTISPEKTGGKVHVKRAGNFNKLLVIKIDRNFAFEGRLIDRRKLGKGSGTHASVSWSALGAE